jgi:hypothetical protein
MLLYLVFDVLPLSFLQRIAEKKKKGHLPPMSFFVLLAEPSFFEDSASSLFRF